MGSLTSFGQSESPGGPPASQCAGALDLEGDVGYLVAAIRDSGQSVFAKPGQALFSASDAADCVFAMVSGLARTSVMLPDGRRQIIGFHEAGDLLGVTLAENHVHSAEAVTSAKLQMVSRVWLQSMLDLQPNLCRGMISFASRGIEAARRHVVLLGRMTARERLCAFLLERPVCDTGLIEIPMPRIDIADYLGLTIETVSRTLTQLRVEGIIRTNAAHVIELTDRKRLLECLEASRRPQGPRAVKAGTNEASPEPACSAEANAKLGSDVGLAPVSG